MAWGGGWDHSHPSLRLPAPPHGQLVQGEHQCCQGECPSHGGASSGRKVIPLIWVTAPASRAALTALLSPTKDPNLLIL